MLNYWLIQIFRFINIWWSQADILRNLIYFSSLHPTQERKLRGCLLEIGKNDVSWRYFYDNDEYEITWKS